MKTSITYILIFLTSFTYKVAQAQQVDASDEKYAPLENITWNGYFRSFMYYRNLPIRYDDTPGGTQWYKLNGGYNEPLLRLNAKASPASNTTIEIEYTFDNLLTGLDNSLNGNSGVSGRVSLPLQSLRFNGNHTSKYGSFNFQAGGIRFYSLTPLTFGGFSTRYDPFERVPWESEDHPWTRYSKVYGKSQNTQAANSRFGSAMLQGFILEGKGLPGGLGFNAIFGKSINSGGYQAWVNNNPKKIQAYRVYKKFSSLFMGINYYNSFGRVSETSRQKEISNIITTDMELSLKHVSLNSEVGYGDYASPAMGREGASIIKLDASLKEADLWVDLDLQYFHVGIPIVNQSSELINSSTSSASNIFGDTANLGNNFLPGVVTDFRQLTNNRQGINVKVSKSLGEFKFALGLSASQELVRLDNAVTFQHRLNKDTRSRFNVFQSGVGPYNRITSVYLTTFETVSITRLDQDYLKSFNTLDLTLKYKLWMLGKEFIFMNYTNFNSVQAQLRMLPTGSDNFLSVLYSDLNVFAHVMDNVVFVGMVGVETAKGGVETEVAENGLNLDQVGYSAGLGLDLQLGNRAGLFFRQRWFSHYDKNFVEDKFSGSESSLELKIFF